MFIKSPLSFNESEIRSFSERYIMSLESEYLSWHNRMKNMNHIDLEASVKDRKFSELDFLEAYPNPLVLDVGAGRRSVVGTIPPEPGHVITLRACDVLAVAYDLLNQLYGLKPYVKVEFAFVERLTDRYEQSNFDIVRMSNALDHCYDPFTGIFEMLKVAKIGGTVRLIHHENEAEREMQYGMHQWNITSEGEDSLLIWRKDFRADMRDILKGCARIQTKRRDNQNGICNIISDIVKTDDIETPAKTGMNIFDEAVIRFCLMKTSERFSSAYKRAGNHDPFRKSMFKKLIAYAPMGLRKYVPSWLERSVRKLSRKIGY